MSDKVTKLNEEEYNAIKKEAMHGGPPYWLKIEAIRKLRIRVGLSLAEAKEAVDFAIWHYKELGLEWYTYNINFELHHGVAAPVEIIKDETADRFFVTCPCGCCRRFEVLPPFEVSIVPTLDDEQGDPLLGDEEEILKEDPARAMRQQDGVTLASEDEPL